MKSTAKLMTAIVLAGAVSTAMAKNQDLGVLPTSGATFGNSFTSVQNFVDTYQFTLGGTGNGATGTETDTAWALSGTRDVQVSSIALRVFGSTVVPAGWSDSSASQFSFSGLTAGVKYELVVTGSVGVSTGLFGGSGSYTASISPVTSSVASAAPEPAEMLLMAMGLGGVGFWVRRQKRA